MAQKSGNSVLVTIPKQTLRQLSIKAGDYLVCETVGELFVVCKHERHLAAMTEPSLKRALELITGGAAK